MPRHLGKLA